MYLFSICIVCCEVSGKENWQSAYTSVNSLSDMQLLFFRWLLLLHETCPHVWSWSWIRVQSNVYQNIAKGMKIQWTLFNPALVIPFNTRGGRGGRSAPKLFPEPLEGITCSKMGLNLTSPENLQIMTQLRYLSHLVPELSLFEKEVTSTSACSIFSKFDEKFVAWYVHFIQHSLFPTTHKSVRGTYDGGYFII